jgi:hypothetical protein
VIPYLNLREAEAELAAAYRAEGLNPYRDWHFQLARYDRLRIEATARGCVCHLGSVCGSACGYAHHTGCARIAYSAQGGDDAE